jgi:hypothetical protein
MEVLPNDLVRQCLLRVPYKWNNNLKGVCRSWESMVSNPKFYVDIKIYGMTEQLLCLIQQDPSYFLEIRVCDPVKGTSERLSPIDDPHFAGIGGTFQCAVVNRKLVLLDGITKSVYIYDFESARWSHRADMPTHRYSFSYSVDSSTGLVYIAGGIVVYVAGRVGVDEPLEPLSPLMGNHPLAAAEAYNVEEDRWEILPSIIQPHGLGCDDVFMEGKFMVFTEDRSAEVFKPSAGTWRRWENMRFRGDLWKKCVVSPSGELYTFSDEEHQVMKYDGEKNVWTVVDFLLQSAHFLNCIAQFGDWIFVAEGHLCKIVTYLFNLSTGEWFEVNVGFWEDYFLIAAATVEI